MAARPASRADVERWHDPFIERGRVLPFEQPNSTPCCAYHDG